jgi:hypothetical protein
MAKKIGYWDARAIATRIAEKAFEHLLNPQKEVIRALTVEAYNDALQSVGMTKKHIKDLCALDIIKMSKHCTVNFDPDNGVGFMLGNSDYGSEDPALYVTQELIIKNEDFIAKFKTLWPAYSSTLESISALQTSVHRQIDGKTPAAVKKAWPEVAGFIDDHLGMAQPNDFVIPFESLLARFLPALPAPAAA